MSYVTQISDFLSVDFMSGNFVTGYRSENFGSGIDSSRVLTSGVRVA